MSGRASQPKEDEDANSGGTAPGRLSVNTENLPSEESAQRARSPLSDQQPRDTLPGRSLSTPLPAWHPSRSPGGATSPAAGRDRGYSLRRTLFNRAGPPTTATDPEIELAPASQPPQDGYPFPQTPAPVHIDEKTDPVNVDVDVTITATSSASGPQKGAPPRKRTRPEQLPRYSRWVREQRKTGFLGRIEKQAQEGYKEAKKRILRIQDIPPSKDGRHIYLDPSRRRPCIDERTGKDYIGNSIRSSRYTLWNFLPRQLVFQFSKLANFYFLCISILQLIPGLSTTGTFTTIVPLLCFVALSMAKEGYDDVRRAKLDKAENRKLTKVLIPQDAGAKTEEERWTDKLWQDIKVGDIVKLSRNDEVPADMALLHSDGLNNIAYIETMALDGETNLKAKQPSPIVAEKCTSVTGIDICDALFVLEDPNIDLYNFDGRVTVDGKTLPLTTTEIVYRGSTLRNTTTAIGLVINTGEECKIRMNANKNPRTKAPTMQAEVNKVVIMIVFLVLSLAAALTIAYDFWADDVEAKSWYISIARVPIGNILASFIIMLNTMIPLSLYVSLEIVKLGQLFLMHDVDMYDPVSDTPMESHTTTINEELGQISYIFSDKTGTLTDNVMRFRKMSVAGVAWLHDADVRKEAAALAMTNNVGQIERKSKGKMRAAFRSSKSSFSTIGNNHSEAEQGVAGNLKGQYGSSMRPAEEPQELNTLHLLEYLKQKPHGVFARKARFFLLSLALCHTCLPEVQVDGSIDFQAASPDELALVRAAQDLGYIVIDRAAQTITLKTKNAQGKDVEEVYTVLDVIEFTSKRKRMSIIIRFPDGRLCIFTKGADSIIIKRLKMANFASEKRVEVERRASMRKSMEAEHALRRRSSYANASPRNSISMELGRSLDLARNSIGGIPRTSAVGNKFRPLRNEVETWLKERETGVDRRSMDAQSAFVTPRHSTTLPSGRQSFASVFADDDEFVENMVDESLAVNEAAVIERTLQHIDDFATEGLRTLLYGFRFLDEQDYNNWKNVYHEATTSLVNRSELIEAAGELIEKDFELAGATAIEDKLQKGVPETIDKLRRANIKMWMLTGDKRETAINIGHSCRLIKDFSMVVILDTLLGNVAVLMGSTLLELEGDTVAHSVIVVDGQTLADIEANETLQQLFFSLAVLADSVICCRASPSQKALLVKKIRQQINRSVTLAIGDGANDIAMIQEAHVGIGITGKEGLQAARISDYSIAQFRFLQKLLLVHGRWNYVRTGKYVLGTFWKEMLFYLSQALYQRWNGYSGTSLYESWSLSMFNTLFTSLAVIFLGIFEQDLRASTLLAVPELYSQGQRNEAFGIKKYFGWMFVATCEAMLLYFMTMGIYGWNVMFRGSGVFAIGDCLYTVMVIVINTKLLFIELHNKTIMPLAAFIITIGGWFLWNIILNYTYNLKEQLAYGMRWGFVSDFGPMPEWWLTVIACVMVFFVFEICVIGLRKMFLPSDTDVFQELEKDDQLRRKFEETCKDVLQYTEAARESFESEQCSEEERKREEEVRELLEVRQRNLAEEELKKQNEFLRPGSGRRKSIPFSGRMSLERKRSGGLARPRPSLERRMSSDKRRVSMGVRRKSDFDMAVPEHEESKDGPSQ